MVKTGNQIFGKLSLRSLAYSALAALLYCFMWMMLREVLTDERMLDEIPPLYDRLWLGGGLVFFLSVCVFSEKNWTRVFWMVLPVMAVLYFIALPVGNVPDEHNHIRRIYTLTQFQLFPKDGAYLIPSNLTEEGILTQTLNLSQIRDQLLVPMSSELVPDYLDATTVYPPVSYLPQAISMWIAGRFTDSVLLLAYSARIGSLLVTFTLFALAIRFLPGEGNKKMLMLIVLLPMCLQESISASADGMSIGLVALSVAFVMKNMQRTEAFSRGGRAAVFLLMAGLFFFKVMYLPFVLLFWCLDARCYGGERKKRIYLGCSLAVLALALLGWWVLYKTFGAVDSDKTDGIQSNLIYLVIHPMTSLKQIYRTLRLGIEGWPVSTAGSQMGQLDIQLPNAAMYLTVYVFIIEAVVNLRGAGESVSAKARRIRRGNLAGAFLSTVLILLFLWCWWTPRWSRIIAGIQGRYFLPILLPLTARVTQRGQQEGTGRKSVALFVCLSLYVAVYVLLHTLGPAA